MAKKYTIETIDHGSGVEFTSYYYHKQNPLVYEVKHGNVCEARIRSDLNLGRNLRTSFTLPRYIVDNI